VWSAGPVGGDPAGFAKPGDQQLAFATVPGNRLHAWRYDRAARAFSEEDWGGHPA
jgi:hypothetical protein